MRVFTTTEGEKKVCDVCWNGHGSNAELREVSAWVAATVPDPLAIPDTVFTMYQCPICKNVEVSES